MGMALASWLCALGVDRGKRPKVWLAAAVVIDLGLIGYFKYAGFLLSIFGAPPAWAANIVLPIGISFYTFQLLTYVVDVYRGEAPAQKSYWNVLLYAALFHQCIAGPIVRYQTVAQELFSDRPRSPEICRGVSRFCGGLAKKVLLANPCGALAETMILSESAAGNAAQLAQNLLRLDSGPFAPMPQDEKWEIHTVFLHFPSLAWEQNPSLPALADLISGSLKRG